MLGCVWLCLQAQEGNIYFTELAERVEYGNYGPGSEVEAAACGQPREPLKDLGQHYLSNATCLRRPHLFSTALLVQYG